MKGEEIYRLEGVSFSYGEVPALRDVDLRIGAGENIVVVGANGTGKSTFLKILDGLYQPSEGTVSFYGRRLNGSADSKAFRERVGLVFQEPDVQLFCPTVFEELCFGPLQLGLEEGEVRARVEDVLSMLGLTSLRDRAPYSLSAGEKKKVAIASVLTQNPDVLLLDEPTTGLDPRTQVWLMGLLYEFKRAGKTFVVATHDLGLAEDVADRVMVLDESHRIVADGRPVDILYDKELLIGANLIHEHVHRHGKMVHAHSHGPNALHDEHG